MSGSEESSIVSEKLLSEMSHICEAFTFTVTSLSVCSPKAAPFIRLELGPGILDGNWMVFSQFPKKDNAGLERERGGKVWFLFLFALLNASPGM